MKYDDLFHVVVAKNLDCLVKIIFCAKVRRILNDPVDLDDQ